MPGQFQKKGIIINIRVEPRSSRSGLAGPYGKGFKVKLTSPPVEGRANAELVEILAKTFNVKKRNIEILSGSRSRNKMVRVIGVENIDNILENIG